jgi:hypothetical protein
MVLGANSGHVVRLVLRGAFRLIAFGLVLGIPVSVAIGWVVRSRLYGLNPYDPTLFATAVAVLGLFGFIATVDPAFAGELDLTGASAAHRITLVAFLRTLP